jgi:hypothetical protein
MQYAPSERNPLPSVWYSDDPGSDHQKRAANSYAHTALNIPLTVSAAQQASDDGLGVRDIEALGRRSSGFFWCYFKRSLQQRFALSRRLLALTSGL